MYFQTAFTVFFILKNCEKSLYNEKSPNYAKIKLTHKIHPVFCVTEENKHIQ